MKNMNMENQDVTVNKMNSCEMLPGGGFFGGEQKETLPGGGFHGGEQKETLPGGGFHGGEQKVQNMPNAPPDLPVIRGFNIKL